MIPQDSPQWLPARVGVATASNANAWMSVKRDGKPTAEYHRYAVQLVAERMAGVAAEHFVTDAMRWGIEQEQAAKDAYEMETGAIIAPSGLYLHPRIEHLGATPDGEIGADGLIECKCPSRATYTEWLIGGVVPEQHVAQMTCQLVVTGRRWCDFVAYDPRVIRGPTLFIRRFEPTDEARAAFEAAAEAFLAYVERMFEAATTAE